MKLSGLIGPSENEDGSKAVNKTGLILGIILCFAGVIGVLGLRAGFIQSLLGDAAPYPGIGSVEPMGHVVSIIPTILGLVVILGWGIKNDPVYHEMEKAREEDAGAEEPEIEEPEPEPPKKVPAPVAVKPPAKVPAKKPVAEAAPKAPAPEKPAKPAAAARPEPAKPKPAPKPDPEAEKRRLERCNKMMSFASVLPEDEKKLRDFIESGMSVKEFTQEIKKAVERKKKLEEEQKRLTADEKASVIQDDLVSELEDLEEELESEDLEDMKLASLDELEDDI